MKISVIMTVKNGQEFIASSLKSVANQTYSVYEIVVVDDGSQDDTINKLNNLKKELTNLVIVETSGIGRASALNLAIEKSTGDWVANIDVDDLWHPDKLKMQTIKIYENDEIEVSSTGTEIIYNEFSPTFQEIEGAEVLPLKDRHFFTGNKVNHSSILMKKDLLKRVGFYNYDLNKQIDLDLWFRILIDGKVIYKVLAPLTYKRLHRDQSFENKNRLPYIFHSFKLTYKFLIQRKAPFKYYIFNCFRFLYHLLPSGIRNYLRRSFK